MDDIIRVLAVDDEETMLRILKRTLESDGFHVETYSDPEQALTRLQQGGIDLIVTDLMMDKVDGFTLLEQALILDKAITVIVITAFSSVESAVKAMKLGAYDFIPKPFDPEHLLLIVRRAIANKKLLDENIGLKKVISERNHLGPIIGTSKGINHVKSLIDKVKDTDGTVLITGESGTGKELVARAIHNGSSRAGKKMVTINCGALPDNLLESELFGYEPGAFSGALKKKLGLLELADGGTLFLDEVGTISQMMQVKLLRFIQDRSFIRLGGKDVILVDVRILAATNENILMAVDVGTFRKDLYYRLNVIGIEIPPLRERREDILLLAKHFLQKHKTKIGRPINGFTEEAITFIINQPWEGNVRELENCLESAVTFCEEDMIDIVDFPGSITRHIQEISEPANISVTEISMSLAELETLHIKRVMDSVAGNKSQAARILRIDYTTMLRKLKKCQIEVKKA